MRDRSEIYYRLVELSKDEKFGLGPADDILARIQNAIFGCWRPVNARALCDELAKLIRPEVWDRDAFDNVRRFAARLRNVDSFEDDETGEELVDAYDLLKTMPVEDIDGTNYRADDVEAFADSLDTVYYIGDHEVDIFALRTLINTLEKRGGEDNRWAAQVIRQAIPPEEVDRE